MIKMFRGISVPMADAPEAKRRIMASGLSGDEGGSRWKSVWLSRHFNELWEHPSLFREVTQRGVNESALFACGEEGGASYYACAHHAKPGNTGLLIVFLAPEESIAVDCRDFLCPAFQLWDSRNKFSQDAVGSTLARLYGDAILPYFRRAAATKNQQERITLCNLASFDQKVVHAHYANSIPFRGRYGVTCASSFIVRAPIPAASILDVCSARGEVIPVPQVTLDDVR
ncbi:hypothetical protein NR798_25955 [Archangium gephyra]|uniref:hypothetical protein n=1 Tax=Archangium gephyra TaxID=48 RepID=UPI0035D4D6A5